MDTIEAIHDPLPRLGGAGCMSPAVRVSYSEWRNCGRHRGLGRDAAAQDPQDTPQSRGVVLGRAARWSTTTSSSTGRPRRNSASRRSSSRRATRPRRRSRCWRPSGWPTWPARSAPSSSATSATRSGASGSWSSPCSGWERRHSSSACCRPTSRSGSARRSCCWSCACARDWRCPASSPARAPRRWSTLHRTGGRSFTSFTLGGTQGGNILASAGFLPVAALPEDALLKLGLAGPVPAQRRRAAGGLVDPAQPR